jgi:3-methyl-2-oxobutanoate hydroxymethyltransferase
MTAQRFFQMKRDRQPIAMLTAYDAPTARIEAAAGVDVILVGDSVGTNMLGYASEKDVTIADMMHHVRAVRRGAAQAFVIGDLPYGTCDTVADALVHSRSLVQAGADMVKFEGAQADVVEALKRAGFSVCCHIGLEPQHHEEKRVKGRTAAEARRLVEDARRLDAAGADMLVLELVPEEVGRVVTAAVRMPTIGIGAGRYTDGQVLVVVDVLGFTQAAFKHNKRYADVGMAMHEAFAAYVGDVHAARFPTDLNAFRMKAEEAALFLQPV